MTIISRLFYIEEEEKVCCNCKHFVQHYTYNENSKAFIICNAGHCIKFRTRNKTPKHKACEHFEQKKGEQVNV